MLKLKSEYAIVVIGYNRLHSLMRLCNSLINADYDEKVDLVISLDYCEDCSVRDYAEKFEWEKGAKKVVCHENRLGLKDHILSCGRFLESYDAIAILEDDIYVSPCFYKYMRQAVSFYKNCQDIAGISMYSPRINGYNSLGFVPAQSEFDIFFMQMSQSWGEIWLKNQWNEFYDWYLKYKDNISWESLDIPEAIKHWGNKSWVKYYTTYCIIKNKFFVYPYMSLTTCFGDVGVHTKTFDNTGQVELYAGKKRDFIFSQFDDENVIKYDGYLERIGIRDDLLDSIDRKDICINLYGDKSRFEGYKYVLTTNQYKAATPIHAYALQLIPHELNVEQKMEGEGIFLYAVKDIEGRRKRNNKWKLLEYHASHKVASNWNMMWMYFRKLCIKYLLREGL